jgi:hypothetical protein
MTALRLRETTGSDLTLDRDNLVIVRKFEVIGDLPYTKGGDAFDWVSSQVMGLITASYPTYGTSMGTLYWNSIQLHEQFYAQKYDISVTYSPYNKQSGTYQISVDQAVGNVHVTAGERIAVYPTTSAHNNKGTFFNGLEVTGTEVPVPEDRISISYRHPQAYLNAAYIRAVGALRGYPNSDTFLGYAAGEVMYLGGNFTQSDSEASASYAFSISPNATNITVADILIADKKGFDVLSPIYKPDTNTASGVTVGVKVVEAFEIIRPMRWKAYKSVFGWG